MQSWLKVTLWTLFGVVASCGLALGFVVYSINSFFDRDTPENARLAPIIIDEPIHECSISPRRNFVVTETIGERGSYQKIYNLKTGDEIDYPAISEANIYDNNTYGDTIGWLNDSTQDVVLVHPHWMINITTGIVTKAKPLASQQYSSWWEQLLMPDDREPDLKSPDQHYIADSGRIYRATTGKLSMSDLVVAYSNDYPEICSNAWEPDSSGYYFADVYWRVRTSGPLRFLKNPER